MKCEDWQELILRREELEPRERADIAQHLLRCDDCRLWTKALEEIDATLATELKAALDPSALRPRIARAVGRERRWMAELPELLDALGWSALGIMALAGLLLWTSGRGWMENHLDGVGAVTLGASLAWAGLVLWKSETDARRLL
jgi:hypothetical protein